MALQWLYQTSDPLTYTPGDVCNRNSPECILTRVTSDGPNITPTTEEETTLCRFAKGDLDDSDDIRENPSETQEDK